MLSSALGVERNESHGTDNGILGAYSGALQSQSDELASLIFRQLSYNANRHAQSVCDLLRKIAAMKLDVLIILVLDNARYQKCRLVTALALSLNIELLFLPPYSPNLNVIERLWKFVKKQVLYSKYYSDFGDFKRAIRGCLDQTHTTHKKEVGSLLTLKFQVFKKVNIVPI